MSEGLPFSELCIAADLTQRTVRYYMKRGLLPSAPRTGPGVRYPETVLRRLLLIRRLKDQDLPLARIRERLTALTDEEVQELLDAPSDPAPESASDYVKAVLRQSQPSLPSVPFQAPLGSGGVHRARWERIQIHPDVEIHVRRPLSRNIDRKVRRLIEAAGDILKGSS